MSSSILHPFPPHRAPTLRAAGRNRSYSRIGPFLVQINPETPRAFRVPAVPFPPPPDAPARSTFRIAAALSRPQRPPLPGFARLRRICLNGSRIPHHHIQ